MSSAAPQFDSRGTMPEVPALQMKLITASGDTLRIRSLVGSEEISQLFEYDVLALSEDEALSADDLLGTTAAVSIETKDGTQRWLHGLIASFGIEGVDGRFFRYRIKVRPSLWLMTRASNLRIFQNKSVSDIVNDVLKDYSINLSSKLTGTYAPRTYCVQYRESDFNFVSRLLEEEGIFYFFRHSPSQHEWVLADAPGVHDPVAGFSTLEFLEGPDYVAEKPLIRQWQMRHEIQSGKMSLRDYNFETPSADMTGVSESSGRKHAEAEHEVYDYPGLYPAAAKGKARADIRLDEARSRFGRFNGKCNVLAMAAGTRFTLHNHPRDDQNVDYVVLSTRIDIRQAGFEAGVADDAFHEISFTLQRFSDPLRPQRLTPKPAVAGPQTALVVGDGSDGDIIPDKYGRVNVQFYWDRLGKKNGQSSCWVRVASPSAGNGWGMISLPRLGQEVVVDFLEGDPDQPLITGRVHNAEQLPPYALPDHATVSTLKSRSKQGSADQFNELRFEDKAGDEYLLLHAQKDRLEFVEETLRTVVGKHEHRTIKENLKEMVLGEYHQTVDKDVKQYFGAKLNTEVSKDLLIKTGGVYSLQAAQDITGESGAAISFKSSRDMHLKIGSNLGADAGQNVHIKGGMNVVIEAGMQISLKAGGSSIVLGPDGVSITGVMVKINSGGSPGSGNGASPVAPTDPEAPEEPEMPEDPLSHR
jgi:type VI secretion system secreted protein VgrG